MNGHSSVVSLLLEQGSDANAKNAQNLTALDLSCRKGYFEISKRLISCSNIIEIDFKRSDGDYPLLISAKEGAHEVVVLLLANGARIDQLNDSNENCLDIAINNGHRDVIRELLDHKDWLKLIRFKNYKFHQENENIFELVVAKSKDEISAPKTSTIASLFNNQMWDIIKLLLDRCEISQDEMDFSIIDIPSKTITDQPLMLIARSGQESLIKHKVTNLLLQLKWRLVPRCAFYFNLVVYFLYLLLFSWYAVEMSIKDEPDQDDSLKTRQFFPIETEHELINKSKIGLFKSKGFRINQGSSRKNSTNFLFDLQESVNFHINKTDNSLSDLLVIIIIFQLFKELLILMFLDGVGYFLSIQNISEILTYLMSLVSLLSIHFYTQCNYASIAILFAYILLPLFLQKFKTVGIYVIALQRSLTNSAKLFPIFIILFTGFILSFRVRSYFGVNYSESDSIGYSLIRTITMVAGELDTSKMGLYNTEGFLPNVIIYFLFIGLMCTIVLNLFVGIAVDDIKTILDEADLQLVCMKIIFVLKVQSAVLQLCGKCCCFKNILNMNYKKYKTNDNNQLFKLSDTIKRKFSSILSTQDNKINLLDPQKRLENTLNETTRIVSEKIINIKNVFSIQINSTEAKMINSQIRLQDSLNDFALTTNEQIGLFRDEVKSVNTKLKNDLVNLQKMVEETNADIAYTNKYFNTRLAESEQKFLLQIMKLESILIDMTKKALFQFESVKESCITEPKNLKSVIIKSERILEDFLSDLIQSNKQNISLNDTLFENFIQNEIIDKLIKPGNDELKYLINNMFDKTIDRFQSNETNFYFQKVQLEAMAVNLKTLFVDSIEELKSNFKKESETMKRETVGLDVKLNSIEAQLLQLNDFVLRNNKNTSLV